LDDFLKKRKKKRKKMITKAIAEIKFFVPTQEQFQELKQYSPEAIRWADNRVSSALKSQEIKHKYGYFKATIDNYIKQQQEFAEEQQEQAQRQKETNRQSNNNSSIKFTPEQWYNLRRLRAQDKVRNDLGIGKLTPTRFEALSSEDKEKVYTIFKMFDFSEIMFFEEPHEAFYARQREMKEKIENEQKKNSY
jgi:hypothetical protein